MGKVLSSCGWIAIEQLAMQSHPENQKDKKNQTQSYVKYWFSDNLSIHEFSVFNVPIW